MKKCFDIKDINQTIADLIEDHVLVCNPEGKIVYSNRAMQSCLGYSEEELLQKSFLDIIDVIHIDKAKSCIKNVLEKPSGQEELIFKGRKNVLKLHVKLFLKNNLIFIYGNEKYVDYERLQKKLQIEIANAVRIHRQSLPEKLPEADNISFAHFYIPAQELGGDLFDAFKVDNELLNDYFEQYVCFIADVSGHGLDSAMLAIFVKDTIRSFFKLKHTPGQLLSPKEIMHFFVEQYINEGYPDEYLVCLFLVIFDLNTKELTYCNAGFHMCPLLVKDSENIIELNKGGLPVTSAIDPDLLKYDDHSMQISPEMTLYMMSDGLPEQRSDNEYYEERLKKLVAEIYSLKPAEIVEKIQEDFTNFLRYEKINDDITMVVVKLT